MEELDDFGAGDFSLEDLVPEKNSKVGANLASNKNMAATITAIDGQGDIDSTYRSNLSSLEDGPGNLTEMDVLKQLKDKSFADARESFISFLSDPNVTDQEKATLTDNFFATQGTLASTSNMLSTTALEAPSSGETAEAERTRIDIAGIVTDVNDNKRAMQSLVNAEAAKSDPTIMGKVQDFLQYFIPFTEASGVTRVGQGAEDTLGAENVADILDSMVLAGNAKVDLREAIKKIPVEDRLSAAEALVDIINENSNIVLVDDNDFFRMDMIRTMVEDGYYDDWDQMVDNIASIAEMTFIGIPAARFIKGSRVFSKLDFLSQMKKRSTRTDAAPASPANNYSDTNPEKARHLHDEMAGDATGELAEAAYGTNVTEAVASDILPQVGGKGTSIENKVSNIDAIHNDEITPNADVMDFVNYDGAIYYSKDEKIRTRAAVNDSFLTDFKNAVGLHSIDNMYTFTDTPDGAIIKGVYGPADGGFSNPQHAIEMAKFALRDYGIADRNVSLLQNVGGEWITVDKASTEPGAYRIGVDYQYRFAADDIDRFTPADVKNNIFDQIPAWTHGTAGTLQRSLIDPASSLHPTITLSANVGVDRAAGLEKTIDKLARDSFVKPFNVLKSKQQDRVINFIKSANANGIEHTKTSMKAAGMSNAEMDIMRSWREMQDTIYELENIDMVRTLRNSGYKAFIDKSSDSQVYAKPIKSRGSIKSSVSVFDVSTGGVKILNPAQIDKIYAEGGTVARMKQPAEASGTWTDLIISLEKPETGYLRSLNDDDKVLNYRKGYYQIHYKAPKFVEEVIRDKFGKEVSRKAVSTAGNIKDANTEQARLTAIANPDLDIEYIVRSDISEGGFADMRYQEAVSRGRTAQRLRGKRLNEAVPSANDPTQEHILDPLEALTKSIRSVSRRVAMRDQLEATKARFLQQYDKHLQKDNFGNPQFPDSIKDIGQPGQKSGKDVGDARTTYEYIRYLENGYVNAIDDAYKSGVNWMADKFGELNAKNPNKVFSTSEDYTRTLATTNPTMAAKHFAFTAYLALNPFRQAVLQSNQAIRLFALEPAYAGSAMAKDMAIITEGLLLGEKAKIPKVLTSFGNMSHAEAVKMIDDFKKSGMWAAVDASNLTRNSLNSLADMTTFTGKAKNAAGVPFRVSQAVGFDIGEEANILSAWLTFRHRAKKAGKTMDAETMAQVGGEARNFTYNMNHAGDMPYNQNLLNMKFQFMQVPHKALTQLLGNRAISGKERAKLAAFDIFMWGIPRGAVVAGLTPLFGEDLDQQLVDTLTDGFQDLMLNKVGELATGEESNVDFGDLAPYDFFGVEEFVTNIWTTDILTQMADSPSGQLFFGGNPRLTNAFRDAARYFTLIDDGSDVEEFKQVAVSFGKISSGYSNYFKLLYAKEYGAKINSVGSRELDTDISPAETAAMLFGFSTKDESRNRQVLKSVYENSKFMKQDMDGWLQHKTRRLSNKGLSAEEIRIINITDGEAWRVWRDMPAARSYMNKKLDNLRKSPDRVVYDALRKTLDMKTPKQVIDLVNASGLPQEKKDSLINEAKNIRDYRESRD